MKANKWLVFDFGGCLDSDGIHSRELFFNAFSEEIKDLNWAIFQEAYSIVDNKINTEGLVRGKDLKKMNTTFCELLLQELKIKVNLFPIEKRVTDVQSYHLKRNCEILEQLKPEFSFGIISNFSGNLSVILKEFNLNSYFSFVLDSSIVGISKPSPEIFHLAVKSCGVPPSNIYYAGDNPKRDILPAKKIGLNTILIKGKDAKYIKSQDDEEADIILNSLLELPSIIQKI